MAFGGPNGFIWGVGEGFKTVLFFLSITQFHSSIQFWVPVVVVLGGWLPAITLSQPNCSYGCFVVGVVVVVGLWQFFTSSLKNESYRLNEITRLIRIEPLIDLSVDLSGRSGTCVLNVLTNFFYWRTKSECQICHWLFVLLPHSGLADHSGSSVLHLRWV